jgi:2-hydroxy-6-oxonona-2,4-dienedioate hydrolase
MHTPITMTTDTSRKPTPVWRDEASRARLQAWHDRFRARIQTTVASETIDTSFGRGHVLFAGPADAPPLICLHAMRTGSTHLLSELQPLATHFRLVAPDLPGQSVMGPPIRASMSDSSLAGWVVEVMDQLRIGNAHLLGISWGGFVARLAASAHPDRFSALVLIVPAGIVNGSHWRGLAEMALPLLRYRFKPSRANLKACLQPLLTTWDDEWASYIAGTLKDMKIDPRIPPLATDEALRSLRVRTLVLGGDQDISFPGHAMVERVRVLIPGVEAEVLAQCKHCPPTTPAFRSWLADRVTSFLSRPDDAVTAPAGRGSDA